MARRFTPSQLKSRIRQAQVKQQQALNQLQRAVRLYNQQSKQAIDNYNRAVRNHNSRVRALKSQINVELARLRDRPHQRFEVTYRSSVRVLIDSYERLDAHHAAHDKGPAFDRLMDLAEREVLSSLKVSNALLGEQPKASVSQVPADPAVERMLQAFPGDLVLRWRGAIFALHPNNPDAARHFCTSAREILTAILDQNAADDEVKAAFPGETLNNGRPTRRAKIKYYLQRKGIAIDAVSNFIVADVDNALELFSLFNKGTHGSAGRFSLQQLFELRKRVESTLGFLVHVVT